MKKFTITLIALLFVYFSNNLKAQSFADSIKVPNVFTPNMDGINDVFKASWYSKQKKQGSIGTGEQPVSYPAPKGPIFTYYN